MHDENGKPVTVTMGSYGVGVSRAVAAIAEANHDDIGLCWPREIAPADVHLVIAGKGEPAGSTAGNARRSRSKQQDCACCSTIVSAFHPA